MYTGSLDPFSNRADWKARFRVVDTDTGEDVDLTGCTVTLGVYDTENKSQRFTGSNASGGVITLLAYTDPILSVIEWTIDKDTTNGFCAGTYNVGVTIENDDQTVQFIVGSVACVDGNVP
jgi:hypothetical protein